MAEISRLSCESRPRPGPASLRPALALGGEALLELQSNLLMGHSMLTKPVLDTLIFPNNLKTIFWVVLGPKEKKRYC